MKKSIHPQGQKVVFQDIVTGQTFLIESTIDTADTILWSDGQNYPLVKVEISSASHPVFTGSEKIETVSTRRERFEKRYAYVSSFN